MFRAPSRVAHVALDFVCLDRISSRDSGRYERRERRACRNPIRYRPSARAGQKTESDREGRYHKGDQYDLDKECPTWSVARSIGHSATVAIIGFRRCHLAPSRCAVATVVTNVNRAIGGEMTAARN